MFTGIVQSTGSLVSTITDDNIYSIKTLLNLDNCNIGSSICCDGVCLTIINIEKNQNVYKFDVNISEETLQRSNLKFWLEGNKINLEKSLRVGDEISGHYVYGHIDTTILVEDITKINNSWDFCFSLLENNKESELRKFIVEKGSIAINGISLTIANVFPNSFNISVIPHTFNSTNLSNLSKKDIVNIEFDPLARYIRKYYEK